MSEKRNPLWVSVQLILSAIGILVGLFSTSTAAQSWTTQNGIHAAIPPALAGRGTRTSYMTCLTGQWLFEPGSNIIIGNSIDPAPVKLTVDGRIFQTTSAQIEDTVMIVVPDAAIPALKKGSLFSVSFPSGMNYPDGQVSIIESTFSLRGSSRTLTTLAQKCGLSGPPENDGGLTVAEIRSQILGKELSWGFSGNGVITTYLPNGRFEGVMSSGGVGRANNGSWELRNDGRICWQTVVSGCFRFFRREGNIFVRRDDSNSQAELGLVTVTER